jgi:hypothetical protein
VKKRYILAGLLASSLSVFGQQETPLYSKKKLRQTDVQLLFSYYTQDNNHSAVTGGIGTEDLQVYSAQLFLDLRSDTLKSFHVDAGVDVISSASTDNIDFVVSSASKVDQRAHLNIGYNKRIRGTGFNYGMNGGVSVESDYTSFVTGLTISHVDPSQSRELSLSFQAFFDDLRWGLFDTSEPQKLIYPSELRYKEWFTRHNRNSFNLSLGYYRTINKRMALGIYPGVMYQTGLLSTPFHRVYFTDNSKRVENLPAERLKFPIGFQLNTFVGSRMIIRSSYRFYWDNFGIAAHTLNIEAPVKLNFVWTLTPFVRLYNQSQANYFNPYHEHETMQEFYTSDYDLSKFSSIKTGLGVRVTPLPKRESYRFREFEIRYAYYKRSDGLTAHVITTYFDFKFQKK